jgi:hypothetical protein
MSLPTRQQRVLDQIEKSFQVRDPRLAALFAMFARLTSHEAMPALESVSAQVSRFLRPVVLVPVLVLVLAGTITGAAFLPCPHCPAQSSQAQSSQAQSQAARHPASTRLAPGCVGNSRTGAVPIIRG